MKYDQTDLVIAPGQRVKIVLKNDDQLPHNLVVLRERGSALAVAMKAWELGEKGFEKHWIPDDSRVLAWTEMADPGKQASLSFRAPEVEGDLDFVCTFPGHATIMNGVLHVTNAPRPGLSNLTYMLYKGSWAKLPDFNALPSEAKVRTDEINDGIIDVGVAQMADGFGLVFDGTLNVPADGRYRFYLSSDDGSRLSIDGRPLIVHDGIHGRTQKRAQISLSKGPHAVQVAYFEGAGEAHLALAWNGPGVTTQFLSKDKAGGQRFEELTLAPQDGRPVIYRGFMGKNQGSRRLISVGFPGQLNAAFDQDQLRLGIIWKGEFLDVGRHWTGRGDGDIVPGGYSVVEMPKGEDFAVLTAPENEWPKLDQHSRALHSRFKGYSLDPSGVPTFRYLASGAEVEDSLEPVGNITKGDEGFLRTITLRAPNDLDTLYFRLVDGLGQISPQADGSFRTGKNVTVSLLPSERVLVRSDTVLVPLKFKDGRARLAVRYSWF
jgi:azurin